MTQAERRGRVLPLLKWVTPVVIVVQVVLVATGVLDVGQAVVIAVGIEVLLAVLLLALAVTARVLYRRLRAEGMSRSDAFLAAAETVLPGPMVAVLRWELGGLVSIILLVRRRKDIPDGATVIKSGSQHKAFLLVMTLLGPLEILIVELIVPWAWVRVVLLVAAIYGTLWMFGFYAAVHTRPHYIDNRRLVVRTGHLMTVSVDIDDVRAARHETRNSYQGDKYKGMVTVTDDWVAVTGMVGTELTLTLAPQTALLVQGKGTVHAGELRFDVDEPRVAIATITARLQCADG